MYSYENCANTLIRQQDLIQDHFGWLSPQHHIMGCALSCLKLNQYYTDVQFIH
ncbi:DUF6734 family protein [Pedobacter sp. JCM 36344]|uniref:DUF6734 family protein n=1 Tax=Pedobacter sp. JCM 36344 TaxID=3374280 RepID=UPI0039788B00